MKKTALISLIRKEWPATDNAGSRSGIRAAGNVSGKQLGTRNILHTIVGGRVKWLKIFAIITFIASSSVFRLYGNVSYDHGLPARDDDEVHTISGTAASAAFNESRYFNGTHTKFSGTAASAASDGSRDDNDVVNTEKSRTAASAAFDEAGGDKGVYTKYSGTAASNDISFEPRFEGTSNFLSLLRTKYVKMIAKPRLHCQDNSLSQDKNGLEIRLYNRAIEVDWIGRNLSSAEPTWSANETSSCHFAALAFPPTEETLEAALRQKVYISAFHTAAQCGHGKNNGAFLWGKDKVYTCLGNNFGGTLGSLTQRGCLEESAEGYPIKMWDKENSNDSPLKCLKLFHRGYGNGQLFNMDEVKAAAAKLPNNQTFERLIEKWITDGGGYGKDSWKNLGWNTRTFISWASMVLKSTISSVPDIDDVINKVIMDITQNETSVLATCVEELAPSIGANNTPRQQHIWKENGVHLKASTMAASPSSLFRSIPDSLSGSLPPPPTAVYSVNAILGSLVHVRDEAYYPGCTAWWNAVSSQKNALKTTNEAGKEDGSPFAKLRNNPRMLHNEMLESCSRNEVKCPFPIYDIVIDVTQVFCGGFFHFMIEVWPRIAPFLDGLLADDMPDFVIRIGCGDDIKKFHPEFYKLLGLRNVTLVGKEPVFAKEVIVPTEGYSHSPLLNYWNMVSVRSHVMQHIGPIPPSKRKTILLIVRDQSRRGDGHIYNKQFIQDLSKDLPDYSVTVFRSSDSQMMSCLECQARAFMAAHVVIGSHGAGLSHTLFMRRGGIVLERIASSGNSGIYAELPFLLGVKYFPIHGSAPSSIYRDLILFADSD